MELNLTVSSKPAKLNNSMPKIFQCMVVILNLQQVIGV